jgi:imidazolonepropionase-like amidohydrolase
MRKTKNRHLTFAVLLICWAFFGANAADAATTAFLNVNVVPMTDESVVAGQTVIVADGLIVAIGNVDSVAVPKEATVVDGTDRYLMPGLAEMHAHVPGAGAQDLDQVLTLFAVNGITTIRSMLGQPSHLLLRQELLDNTHFGPRIIAAGPSLNGDSVSGPDDGARRVRAQHAAGYDFIKIHPGLSADEFTAIATTANELGMPFAGHVPVAVGVSNALRLGMASIDHLDGYIAAMMPANIDRSGGYGGFLDVLLASQVIEEQLNIMAEATAASGTWNVPTQSLFEHRVNEVPVAELRNRPGTQFMPEATLQQWERAKERQLKERGFNADVAAYAIAIRRKLILALHQAGAGLLLGSDAPQVFNVPGYSAHQELGFLVTAGLTPYQALQTGTTAVAQFLGSNTGVVAVGKEADLILLDANPLIDIRNAHRIHGVMLRGQWFTAAKLYSRLVQNP